MEKVEGSGRVVEERLSWLLMSAGVTVVLRPIAALLEDVAPVDVTAELELVTGTPGIVGARGAEVVEDVVELDIIRRGSTKERLSSLARKSL